MPATHGNAGIAASSYILVKRNAEIRSFDDALAFLRHDKDAFYVGDTCIVGKNTDNVQLVVLEAQQGIPMLIGVKLYESIIVTYRNDNTFTTNSGGYLTMMTVSRLKQFSPKWAEHRYYRHNRVIWLNGWYADHDANRFMVNQKKLVGEEMPAPILKRKRDTAPYGTIYWRADVDGNVYSTNSLHPGEFVFPELQYDKIGQDGDFTSPLEYVLKREKDINRQALRGTYGIAKSDVPLPTVNAHRKMWGMPEIVMSVA